MFLSFGASYYIYFYSALCIISAEGELQRDGFEDFYFRAAAYVADADADAIADVR